MNYTHVSYCEDYLMINNTLHIGICDDDLKAINHIATICNSYTQEHNIDIEISTFISGNEVLDYVGTAIDILFLDICLPDMTGINIKDRILNRSEFLHIVFVSNMDEYVFDAYSVKTIGYELKPCSKDCIYKYLTHVADKSCRNYILKFDDKNFDTYVDINDLLYIKASSNYSEVYTSDKEFVVVYTLKQLEDMFKEFPLIRIHRSYLVNMKTSNIIGNTIRFYNTDTVIMCSRRMLGCVKQAYANYELTREY